MLKFKYSSVDDEVKNIIERDNLIAHPEGGYYIQTYKSPVKVPVSSRYKGEKTRPEYTKINYLLVKTDFSAWHKVNSNEIFRFKEGSSITVNVIDNDGQLKKIKVGDPALESDAVMEYLIEHSQWFSAHVNNKSLFSYLECEVRPGFMFDDFEIGVYDELIKKYPQHKSLIEEYSIKINIDIPNKSHSVMSI